MKIEDKKHFHLAGVIPVAGQPLGFNFPWHDCCMPIAPDFLAIERATVECAYAGCETIWIVCHDDMQPLIKYRLGEYINDPVWASRPYDPKASEGRKPIPIFYVPIHPSDRDKRDCLSWSILYGAVSAYNVSLGISKWVTPDRYYVSFPYGIYPPEILREYRGSISSYEGFCLSYEGDTVAKNQYLGFTFNSEEFVQIRKNLRKKATGLYTSNLKEGLPRERIPIEERYSARFFTLKDVFGDLDFSGVENITAPWYYNIDSWEGYCNFLSSKERNQIKNPGKYILGSQEWNSVGFDEKRS